MRTTKYLLIGALGVAAVLLLTSDKAKPMRDELADKAKKKMDKWKDRLNKLNSNAMDSVEDLKDMIAGEVKGLSSDARDRIEAILSETTKATAKVQKNVSEQLS